MATSHANGNSTSLSKDGEPPPSATSGHKQGGWTTTPFIIGISCLFSTHAHTQIYMIVKIFIRWLLFELETATMFWLTLAAGGWLNNLIVFLINEFNIKSINAAKINSVISGCANFFPLIGAIVADSVLGCYSVIWISSLISLLVNEKPLNS